MKIETLPKYMAREFSRLKFPIIIEFEDHHGKFMHYAEDLKELGKVFVTVLKSRIDYCFYREEEKPDKNVLSLEEIEKLPPQYKEDALKKKKISDANMNSAKENNRIYDLAIEAVKEKDGNKAYLCLHHHMAIGSEDEGFRMYSCVDLKV